MDTGWRNDIRILGSKINTGHNARLRANGHARMPQVEMRSASRCDSSRRGDVAETMKGVWIVYVQHHEPRRGTSAHADVRVRPLAPPSLDHVFISRRILQPMRGARMLRRCATCRRLARAIAALRGRMEGQDRPPLPC